MGPYPELTRRYLSNAIDGFLVLTVGIALAVLLQSEDPLVIGARVLMILLVVTSYEPILTSQLCTVGQRVTGIRVRRHNDQAQRISIARAYLRTGVKVLLGVCSFFAMGFNNERRAAHDLAVGSVVLDAATIDGGANVESGPTRQ